MLRYIRGILYSMFGVGGNLNIENLTLINSNTSYAYKIPDWTRALSIQARPSVDVLISNDPNFGSYITLKSDGAYWEPNIVFSGTLYFKSGTAGIVVEIITWSAKAG